MRNGSWDENKILQCVYSLTICVTNDVIILQSQLKIIYKNHVEQFSEMSVSDGKKRRPNFTNEVLFTMIEAVKEAKEVLTNKFDSKITSKSKNIAWEGVTRQVNIASRVHRETAEVRKKYSDFKALVKNKAASGRKHSGGTGKC